MVATFLLLEVVPGDFRTITALGGPTESSNNDYGGPSGYNDLGQVVFRAVFSDGTEGLFVSDIATIPEPSGIFLLGLSMSIVSLAARHFRYFPSSIAVQYSEDRVVPATGISAASQKLTTERSLS